MVFFDLGAIVDMSWGHSVPLARHVNRRYLLILARQFDDVRIFLGTEQMLVWMNVPLPTCPRSLIVQLGRNRTQCATPIHCAYTWDKPHLLPSSRFELLWNPAIEYGLADEFQ